MVDGAVAAELGWHIVVKDMPHEQDFFYPVFEWSYGEEEGVRGGELRLWPLQGTIVFEDRRKKRPGEGPRTFTDPEKALAVVEGEYGWGKPPGFDEAFQAMLEARQNWPPQSVKEAREIFEALKKSWEELALL